MENVDVSTLRNKTFKIVKWVCSLGVENGFLRFAAKGDLLAENVRYNKKI